jgi:hypothetical protein
LFELSKLKSQNNSLLKVLGATDKSSLPSSTVANKEKKTTAQNSSFNKQSGEVLIDDRSNSHTPPFLLTLEIFKKNVHNCLADSGASLNIMPYYVCLQINAQPKKLTIPIVHLYITKVKVLG